MASCRWFKLQKLPLTVSCKHYACPFLISLKLDFQSQRATLDLFFTNRPSLVDKCLPAPGVADHDMVHIITSATARRNKPNIHLWKRADMDALRRGCTELATTFCQTFNATSPIQDMWTFIKTHLLKLPRPTRTI